MPKTNLAKNNENKKDNEEVEVKVTSTSENKENVDELTKLNEELAKRDKEIADLKNMMLAFMASQTNSNSNNNNDDEEDGYVYINNNIQNNNINKCQ